MHVFIVAMLSLIMFRYIWTKFGEVYEQSVTKILGPVNQLQQRSLTVKPFVRTMRPVNGKVGNFFFVDRMMMLTVLGIILENTASLLLAA